MDRHATVDRALRLLGLGTSNLRRVGTDDQGRMRPDDLATQLSTVDGPAIVCAQLGEIHTGALDPMEAVCELAHRRGAWVHVDGAFGLWARASRTLHPATAGTELADSWSTDAHKWLNVPYDCGMAIVRDPAAHRAAMSVAADYLVFGGGVRDAADWNPELSRRGRSVPVYAAIASLGRSGVADLVDRCCAHARRFARALSAVDGVRVLNHVDLDQVIVRFGDDDDLTRDVVRRVQEDGTCWVGPSSWRGQAVLRISVVGWRTTEQDVDRSVAAIVRCWSAARSAA
jgi:glutamate/tyrosine decarboxylase-like PLP-dependent enzyme